MRILGVDFDENEKPATVRAQLSIIELAMLARLTGNLSHEKLDEIMPGGGEVGQSLYEGSAYAVFNRFYDGGLDEFTEELS